MGNESKHHARRNRYKEEKVGVKKISAVERRNKE
jgi:hypothetical protein